MKWRRNEGVACVEGYTIQSPNSHLKCLLKHWKQILYVSVEISDNDENISWKSRNPQSLHVNAAVVVRLKVHEALLTQGTGGNERQREWWEILQLYSQIMKVCMLMRMCAQLQLASLHVALIPTKTWSKSKWRLPVKYMLQLAGVQTPEQSHRSFLFSPPQECGSVKCPLNILYI